MSEKMISCIGWIPKGACKTIPDDYDTPADADIEALIEQQESLTLEQLKGSIDEKQTDSTLSMAADDGAESGEDASDTDLKDGDDILKALNMDDYDEEEVDDDDVLDRFIGNAQAIDPSLDPFLDNGSDADEEDVEENLIRETDSCILVGTTSENESMIEVYLYDESTSNLYVHHEIVVPAFPLCVQWMNANPRPTPDVDGILQTTGSFAAVGSFLPGIEIWNVDIMNPLEPVCTLGGYESQQDKALLDALEENQGPKKGKKNKKKALKPKLKADSHSDAVMCLAWHQAIPTRLASGSADTTIKLWDITSQQCTNTLRYHKDKVQGIEWNPTEHFILLSGSYDRTVSVSDVRATQNMSWKLNSDVESVKWDPHHPFLFVTATENGEITCRDIRKNGAGNNAPLWSVKAHNKAASSISFNPVVPNLFASASVDKNLKLWDSNGVASPVCIATRNLDVGPLFTMAFDKSSPFVLAAGGKEGCLAIWDIMENAEVNKRYGKDAEKLGFGNQDLPADYIQMQARGIQGKGIGPGVDNNGNQGDESDDDRDEYLNSMKSTMDDDDDDDDDDDE